MAVPFDFAQYRADLAARTPGGTGQGLPANRLVGTPTGVRVRRRPDIRPGGTPTGGGGQKKEDDGFSFGDVLGGLLRTVDYGRAAVTSGVKELTDTIYGSRVGEFISDLPLIGESDEERKANLERMGTGSWNDFTEQLDRRMGFQEVLDDVADMPGGWQRSALGFAGDLALDPLRGLGRGGSFVAKNVGFKPASKALGESLYQAGGTGIAKQLADTATVQGLKSPALDRLVVQAAERGAGALTERGLRRAGISQAERAALGLSNAPTNKAAKMIQVWEDLKGGIKAPVKTSGVVQQGRKAFGKVGGGESNFARVLYNKAASPQMRAQAAAAMTTINRSLADSRKYGNNTVQRIMKSWGKPVSKLDDVARTDFTHGIESRVDDELLNAARADFERIGQEARDAGVPLGDVSTPERAYVPHFVTDDWRKLAEVDPEAAEFIYTTDLLTREGSQQGRLLTEGKPFLGRDTGKATIKEINDIALEVKGVKIFHDDISEIMPRYVDQITKALGRQKQIDLLVERGLSVETATRIQKELVEPERLKQLDDEIAQTKATIDRVRGEQLVELQNGEVVRRNQLDAAIGGTVARRDEAVLALKQAEADLAESGRLLNEARTRLARKESEISSLEASRDAWAAQVRSERPGVRKKAQRAIVQVEKQIVAARSEADGLRTQVQKFLGETFVEPSGPPRYYHGTSSDVPQFYDGGGRVSENLFGPGVYTTDTESVAATYTKKGGGKEPNVYQLEWTGEGSPRKMDLTVPQPEFNREVEGWLGSSYFDEAWQEDIDIINQMISSNASAEEIYSKLREALGHAGVSRADADEFFDGVNYNMRELGYDAFTHRGGVRVGGAGEHNVTIWLDPGKVRVIKNPPPVTGGGEIQQFRRNLAERTEMTKGLVQQERTVRNNIADLQQQISDLNDEIAELSLKKNPPGQGPLPSDSRVLQAQVRLEKATLNRDRLLSEEAAASQAYDLASVPAEQQARILAAVEAQLAKVQQVVSGVGKPGSRAVTKGGKVKTNLVEDHVADLADRVKVVRTVLERGGDDATVQTIAGLEAAAQAADAAILAKGGELVQLEDLVKSLNDQRFIDRIIPEVKKGMTNLPNGQSIPTWIADATEIEWAVKQLPFIGDFMNKYMNLWKGYAILRPGFHARNAYSAMMNIYLEAGGGAFKNVKKFEKFYKLLRENPDGYMDDAVRIFGETDAKMLDDAWGAVAATGSGQTAGEFSAGAMSGGSMNPLSPDFKLLKTNRKFGEAVENRVRGAHAYDVLHRGGTVDQAVDVVNKWHFNYTDITDFDRGMKLLNPFWVFFSRNLALQAQTWHRIPGRLNRSYANLERNMGYGKTPDTDVPEWFGTAGAIRFGTPNQAGDINYLFPDLPAVQFGGQLDALTNPTDLRVLADTAPWVKALPEMWAGKQAFSGIPFKDQGAQAGTSMQLLDRLLPGAQTEMGTQGQRVTNDMLQYQLSSLVPGFGQLNTLAPLINTAIPGGSPLPVSQKALDREKYTALSQLLGIGVRPNTDSTRWGEQFRRAKEAGLVK